MNDLAQYDNSDQNEYRLPITSRRYELEIDGSSQYTGINIASPHENYENVTSGMYIGTQFPGLLSVSGDKTKSLNHPEEPRQIHMGGDYSHVISEIVKKQIIRQLRLFRTGPGFIKINTLPNKTLKMPIDAVVEPDDHGFLARTTDFPLYGYGEDPVEAVQMLKREIESFYDDLIEDDNFDEEHLRMKAFLKRAIA